MRAMIPPPLRDPRAFFSSLPPSLSRPCYQAGVSAPFHCPPPPSLSRSKGVDPVSCNLLLLMGPMRNNGSGICDTAKTAHIQTGPTCPNKSQKIRPQLPLLSYAAPLHLHDVYVADGLSKFRSRNGTICGQQREQRERRRARSHKAQFSLFQEVKMGCVRFTQCAGRRRGAPG